MVQPPPVPAAAIAPVALVVVAFAAAVAPVLPAVARDVQGWRRPEDALDDAALHAHGGAVRQERVDEHSMAADRVDPEHQRQGRRPTPPHQHEPARLGLGHRALGALAALAAPAPERVAPRLDLLARTPVAADSLEVAAGRRITAQLLERGFQVAHVRLDLADALEVLVLTERRLDAPAQSVRRRADREQERDRSVAELELALDRLGRAVDHPQEVVDAVAGVERDDTH